MIYKSTNWGSERLWLDQDKSIIFATNKFLIISAQQTLIVFGGSAKLWGYKMEKKKSRYLLQALEPDGERWGCRQMIRVQWGVCYKGHEHSGWVQYASEYNAGKQQCQDSNSSLQMYGPGFRLIVHCDLQEVWAHPHVLVVWQKNLLVTYKT